MNTRRTDRHSTSRLTGLLIAVLAMISLTTIVRGQCEPAATAQVATGGRANQIASVGDLILGAWGPRGLVILKDDGTGTHQPYQSLGLGGVATRIQADQSTAFVSVGSIIHSVDISSPFRPAELDAIDIGDTINNMKLRNGVLYVATRTAGLRILSVTDPTNLTEIASVPIAGNAVGVAATNSLCYVVTDGFGTIIDITTPSNPQVRTSAAPGGMMVRMTATRAYVASNTLKLIDISDPASPQTLDEQGGRYYVSDMASASGVIYMSAWETCPNCGECGDDTRNAVILAYDVSSGTSIAAAGQYDFPPFIGFRASLEVSGNRLVAGYEYEEQALGYFDLDTLTQTGSAPALRAPVTGNGEDMFIIDGILYGRSSGATSQGYRQFLTGIDLTENRPPALTHSPILVADSLAPRPAAHQGTRGVIANNMFDGSFGVDCNPDFDGYALTLYDYTDPSAIAIGGQVRFGDNDFVQASILAMDADIVFVVNLGFPADDRQVAIFDVSNFNDPVLLGGFDLPGEPGVRAIIADNGFLYILTVDNEIVIMDAVDPSNLVVVNQYALADSVYRMALSQEHLFVTGTNGLHILDTSNLTNLFEVGNMPLPFAASAVQVRRDTLIAYSTSGMNIVDISDISAPQLIATLEGADSAQLSDDGLTIYSIQQYQKITKYQLQQPVTTNIISNSPTTDITFGTTTSDTLAFVSDFTAGLRIFDVTDPANPTEVGTYDTPDRAYETVVVGNYAYVADGSTGLVVLDVSDPASPMLVGSLALSDLAIGLVVDGDFAYMATRFDGLQILDITNPASPVLVGSVDTPGSAQSVTIDGNLVYVADGTGGVQVVDVTARSSPTIVGSYNTPSSARQVLLRGLVAYVPDRTTGLIALDISDPTNPQLISTLPGLGDTRGVTAWGHLAFVADFAGFVHMVDIADPGNMQLLQTVASAGTPRAISNDGRMLYLADGDAGLTILDAQPCWYNSCPVDLIEDGLLDFFDLQAFLNAYSASDGLADWNDDGAIDFFDLQQYLNDYSDGCP